MIHTAARFSLNEICVQGWSSTALIEECALHDVRWVALWRDRVDDAGFDNVSAALRASGIGVSSLCRGGMFTASTDADALAAIDHNRRAIDEAAALEAQALVLVCGPVKDRDLRRGREQVRAGIEAIVDHAAACGVRLAVEPLHPMMVADRSVIVTLAEALTLVEDFPADKVGITLDTYHVFWDPDLAALIERAADRILCYQVSDWVLPIHGGLSSRGLPGRGHINLRNIGQLVGDTGYTGPVEVEVLSDDLWALPPQQAFEAVVSSYGSLDQR